MDMNFETIKQLLIDISLNKTDWIDEYIDICSISSISNEYCEFHHILPVSLFPEYKNESWNIVRLTYKTHREAHRLLSYSGKLAMIKAYSIMQSNRVENINYSAIIKYWCGTIYIIYEKIYIKRQEIRN